MADILSSSSARRRLPPPPTKAMVELASYLDLRSMGQLACTSRFARDDVQNGPLLYIRIKTRLGTGELPKYAGGTGARIERLASEFSLRLAARFPFPDHRPTRYTDPRQLNLILLSHQSLAALSLLSQNMDTLVDGNSASSASETLQYVLALHLPSKRWTAGPGATMDACASVLRSMASTLAWRTDMLTWFQAMHEVFNEIGKFIVSCSPLNVPEVDQTKLHLLIGELLRTHARCCNWKIQTTAAAFEQSFVGAHCVSRAQWEQIFRLATSHPARPANYLDLTGEDAPQPEPETRATKRRSAKLEMPVTHAERRAMEQQPIWDALEQASTQFEQLLGEFDADACQVLGRLLARASSLEVWNDDPSLAMDAHARLLRAIGKVFVERRQAKSKRGMAEFAEAVQTGMPEFIKELGRLPASRLSREGLKVLAGELLRTCAQGSPEAKRIGLAAYFSKWLLPTLTEREWAQVSQRASLELKTSLSYQDLLNREVELAIQVKTKRFSARMTPPRQEENTVQTPPRTRRASQTSEAPQTPRKLDTPRKAEPPRKTETPPTPRSSQEAQSPRTPPAPRAPRAAPEHRYEQALEQDRELEESNSDDSQNEFEDPVRARSNKKCTVS